MNLSKSVTVTLDHDVWLEMDAYLKNQRVRLSTLVNELLKEWVSDTDEDTGEQG